MAEISIPYSLVTPRGTLAFVTTAGGDGVQLRDITGLDAPELRTSLDHMPAKDGAFLRPALRGARYPVLSGLIVYLAGSVATAMANRQLAMDNLAAHLASIEKTDGTLKWTPTGQTERYLTVRSWGSLQIGNDQGVLKPWQALLVAGHPVIYTNSLTTTDTGSSSGATATATNGGNTDSYPILRIFGPATNPKAYNDTQGLSIQLIGTIANGDYVEVDTWTERIYLNGSLTNVKVDMLDIANTLFWSLSPGANTVRLTHTGGGAATKLRVLHRAAWA